MKKRLRSAVVFAFVLVAAICVFTFTSSAADEGKWITAWSTAPTEVGIEGYDNISVSLGDVTARTVVTPTASGTKLRVKFSNYFGDEPITIFSASVAKSGSGSYIKEGTAKPLTFSDNYSVTIPAGAEIYSDEISFITTAGENISVSIYIKEFSEIKTMGLSGGTTYMAVNKGDKTRDDSLGLLSDADIDSSIESLIGSLTGGLLDPALSYGFIKVVPLLADVEVLSPNSEAYSVVVIGDSTVANEYPLYLAQAINETGITDIGISGKGIIGNQLLSDGLGYGSLLFGESLLKRMQRDIIGLDGKNPANVKYVIVKIGVNDIIHPVCKDIKLEYPGIKQPTAAQLIDGYKELFDFCHDNGIKVIAVSITQWKGTTRDYLGSGDQYVRTEAEFNADWNIALTVNEWLSSTALNDGYVDYVTVSADPTDPAAFAADYSTDHLHPTDALQKIWSESLPLSLIGVGKRTAGIGLSETSLTLYSGKTASLKATVTPADAENKAVVWSSSNPSVATVDQNGKVTAKGAGTCTITVKTDDNGYSGVGYSAKCTVKVSVKPTAIKISGTNSIFTTKTTKLKATVEPSNATNKAITWSSSNKNIATVDQNGLVTATGAGTAVITVVSKEDSTVKGTYTVTVKKKISVQSVNLNVSEKTKYVGTTLSLKAYLYPENASFPGVTWSTSDKKVATVDSNGKVTALTEGVAVITCKSVDNPLVKASCVVTVKIKTTGVKISKADLTMYATEKKTLKATVIPSDATNKNVTWSSSNKSVATVDSNGKITAKKAGTCTITVKTRSGGYTAKCKLVVTKYVPSTKLKISKSSVSIKDGKTYTLKATVSPSTASNKSVTWSSSNTKIATVSSKGVIKGINPGTCTITCKSKDTGKKVTCKVTVKRVSVRSINFDESVYKVNCNEKITLNAIISPSNATNQKIKWKSSNTKYATVSSKGKVKGLVAGKTVTITATTDDGKLVAKCKVKIVNVSVKGMKLNKTMATTGVGGSVTLTPIFTPSNATNKKVTWTSSDTKIAKVSSEGVVTPLKDGKCIIYCQTEDGGYASACGIVVSTVKVTGVELNKSSLYVDNGGQFTLKATVLPSNATNTRVNWTSTNTSVCVVNSSGKVTAVGTGSCYIKATTVSGNKVASCRVTVVG